MEAADHMGLTDCQQQFIRGQGQLHNSFQGQHCMAQACRIACWQLPEAKPPSHVYLAKVVGKLVAELLRDCKNNSKTAQAPRTAMLWLHATKKASGKNIEKL